MPPATAPGWDDVGSAPLPPLVPSSLLRPCFWVPCFPAPDSEGAVSEKTRYSASLSPLPDFYPPSSLGPEQVVMCVRFVPLLPCGLELEMVEKTLGKRRGGVVCPLPLLPHFQALHGLPHPLWDEYMHTCLPGSYRPHICLPLPPLHP